MAILTFDTHKAANNLINAGFSKEQAEALISLEKRKIPAKRLYEPTEIKQSLISKFGRLP